MYKVSLMKNEFKHISYYHVRAVIITFLDGDLNQAINTNTVRVHNIVSLQV